MDSYVKRQMKVNDDVFRNNLEQIFQKYSKVDGSAVEVCLQSMTCLTKEGIRPWDGEEAERQMKALKTTTDSTEILTRGQDISGDIQLEDSQAHSEATSLSLEPETTSWESGPDGWLLSGAVTDFGLQGEPVQPEEQDEELERTLNSQGSRLLDLYPSMLSRVGGAWRRQEATRATTQAASAVLRRYRRRGWCSAPPKLLPHSHAPRSAHGPWRRGLQAGGADPVLVTDSSSSSEELSPLSRTYIVRSPSPLPSKPSPDSAHTTLATLFYRPSPRPAYWGSPSCPAPLPQRPPPSADSHSPLLRRPPPTADSHSPLLHRPPPPADSHSPLLHRPPPIADSHSPLLRRPPPIADSHSPLLRRPPLTADSHSPLLHRPPPAADSHSPLLHRLPPAANSHSPMLHRPPPPADSHSPLLHRPPPAANSHSPMLHRPPPPADSHSPLLHRLSHSSSSQWERGPGQAPPPCGGRGRRRSFSGFQASRREVDQQFEELYHRFVCQRPPATAGSLPPSLAALALSPLSRRGGKRDRALEPSAPPQPKRFREWSARSPAHSLQSWASPRSTSSCPPSAPRTPSSPAAALLPRGSCPRASVWRTAPCPARGRQERLSPSGSRHEGHHQTSLAETEGMSPVRSNTSLKYWQRGFSPSSSRRRLLYALPQ